MKALGHGGISAQVRQGPITLYWHTVDMVLAAIFVWTDRHSVVSIMSFVPKYQEKFYLIVTTLARFPLRVNSRRVVNYKVPRL